MTQTGVDLVISGGTLLLSLIGSAFVAGYRWGSVRMRLDFFERTLATMATTEQLAAVTRDVAEIKGMFRMTLRDGSGHE